MATKATEKCIRKKICFLFLLADDFKKKKKKKITQKRKL